MSDRLLSDWEIAKILPQDGECAVCAEIATTQDLKTSQWWVEKIEKLFFKHWTCSEMGCPIIQAWQSFKREVGQ